MGLNIATFKTRALTAVVFVLIMLTGLLVHPWTFFLLFSFIHFGCWTEYQQLLAKIDPGYRQISPFHQYGIMIAGWCLMMYFTHDNFGLLGIRLHELGWWLGLVLIFVLPVTELLFTPNIRPRNILYSALGILYISLSLALLTDIYSRQYVLDGAFGKTFTLQGYRLPAVIIAAIWINDTMAYLVGSMIGKTPLSPISPKKTWEGTAGGAILAVVVVTVAMYFISDGIGWWYWAGVALIAAVMGTLGDLLESKLKRMAGVKDSGNIMPGHGGFLDRFDSLLVAVPFVWLFTIFANQFL